MSFRELRDATILLVAMADFWKEKDAAEKQAILDNPQYRDCFYAHLADKAAQDIVWKAGYNFFSGEFHGFPVD